MIRNTILLLLIIFIPSSAFAIGFEGKFRQGHFIIGKTEPKSKIWIDKKPVKVSSDGFFVFGIDRDRKYDVIITKMNGGKKEKIVKKVQKREYKIQRIDGLPEKKVTPPKEVYDRIKKETETKHKMKLKINFGTMIEVVRAALTANELADTAEFFSFGTNDLTQGTFSFSREDVEGKFLPEYMEKELLERNPFQSIDVNGVGSLIRIGITAGRSIRKNMEVGICGEHGGDPSSIKFCHGEGLSYVSASPHRIPIAIVAAAQAAIEQPKKAKKKKK